MKIKDFDLEWSCRTITGAWLKDRTAGGATGNKYWTNPQYLIDLTDVDIDDNEDKGTALICLMQKDGPNKPEKFYIAFKIYKVII